MGDGCDYDQCAVPPERHNRCAAEGLGRCNGRLGHQHEPRRSQGGKECPVMLCHTHHDCIDNGVRYMGHRLKNDIIGGEMYGEVEEDGKFIGYNDRIYRILDRTTGEVLREVIL